MNPRRTYSLAWGGRTATWLLPEPAPAPEGARFRARRFTAAELECIVGRLSKKLSNGTARDRPPGRSYCVVASEDPLAILLISLAALRANHVVVLPNNLRKATLDEVKRTRFSDAQLVEEGSTRPHTLLDDRDLEAAIRDNEPPPQLGSVRLAIDADEPALICFTSGSTGAPRAHEKTAGQALGEAQYLASTWMKGFTGAVVSSVPAFHLYGFLFASFAPFFAELPLVGALGVLDGVPVAAPPLRTLSAVERTSALISVPAHLHTILATDPGLFVRVSHVFSSAAPLAPVLGRDILALPHAPRLIEVWGSTETGGVATRTDDPGGTWLPFAAISIDRTDDDHLTLRSPFAPPTGGAPYLTNDKVELVEGGFRHLGRDDGVLKVGGKRISLQDLESHALRHPSVDDAACIALPSAGLRNQQIAMVVASQDGLLARELLRHLAQHFDDVVLPRRVRVLSALPRTAAGKLKHSDILDLFAKPESGDVEGSTSGERRVPERRRGREMQLEQLEQSLVQAGFVGFRSLGDRSQGRVLEFEVETRAEQVWFQGHFPEAAVLPGVVQLRSLVQHCACLVWPECKRLTTLSKVKFKRPIVPGDRLGVRLEYFPERRAVSFSINWLGNEGAVASPLTRLLPHLSRQTPPTETSLGTLTFSGDQ